ncbi:YgdB family protein [Rouxiella sp. S1S-2]|uniref:YgdB family protein n=1 Tax=Rouxiella sp. S1S-2 TaxID=2653856 RepID=UPI001D01BE44|nr:YgdB family protein [Rouxiella sp. S1S-2]
MMMMTLGLLALNTVNQHLNAALSLTRSEKNYLVARELAASSLNWGISRRWALQANNQWQCAQRPDAGSANSELRSCFKPAELADHYVVRGEGKGAAVESVFLYQLATMKIINAGEIRLTAIKDGWLDFCPFKDETKCSEKEAPDEPTGRVKFT